MKGVKKTSKDLYQSQKMTYSNISMATNGKHALQITEQQRNDHFCDEEVVILDTELYK